MRLATYTLREITPLYLLGVAAFVLLIVTDLLVILSGFLIRQRVPLDQVALLLLYRFPQTVGYALPLATPFAVLVAFGRMAKDSELKAARALGISPRSFLAAVIFFGLTVSGLTLLNDDIVRPSATAAYERTLTRVLYDVTPSEVQLNRSFAMPDGTVFYAGRITPIPPERTTARLSGLMVERDGEVVLAREGVWDSEAGTWTLHDADRITAEGRAEPAGRPVYEFSTLVELRAPPPAQVSSAELRRRIASAEAVGAPTRELRFVLHRRFADPISALAFAVVAGIFGLRVGNRAVGLSLTVVVILAFYVLWTLSGSFFSAQLLGPAVAAWAPNLLFAGLALGAAARALR